MAVDVERHWHPLIKTINLTIILMILFVSDGNVDWAKIFSLCHQHIAIARWELFIRKLFGK